jgi:hypothetical protein
MGAAFISTQLLAGAALGAGAAFLGTQIGSWLLASGRAEPERAIAQIVGLLIGYTAGVALGVWLSGRMLRGRGACWASLLGAALGVGAGLLGASILLADPGATGWALVGLLGLAGGVAGYHASAMDRRRGANRSAP